MERVARLSLVSLAENVTGLETERSPLGCSMTNGTLAVLASISCIAMGSGLPSESSRDSHLYDLFMPSICDRRTTWRIQSCERSGGSMVKWSPLNFLRMDSPLAGSIQKTS